ncbi:hypothetical protein H310_00816 [Aphanomyces invadans]|uniref:Kinesin motor domain-containing protein n=1 Tax=Aphanomyces invadans TaxID=157072 RepID=A0A024UW32_9STRA|nr:hypothetical protein H310_00816 [Aphanomyces invadans]ETW10549.1 hypothetical protein H310_00816 [Aphanomyces invadans]|eukprot:XP_008861960.1 hypothetical protein H310_00816 [Aphanomyces invadans]
MNDTAGRSGQCVEVAVRVRPFLPKELLTGSNGVDGSTVGSLTIDKEYNAIEVTSASTTMSFCFDHVLGPECTQDQMFTRVLQPKLATFLNGFNTTVIGYGQTASGKSHTIGSGLTNQTEAHWGLIPRMLHEIFRKIEADKLDAQLHVSFLEIYGEDIHDLLLPITSTKTSSARTPLNLRQDRSGVFVQGIREVQVTSAGAALEQLRIGCMARITGSTEMNDTSSRSHAVYTLTLIQKSKRIQPDDATFIDTVTTLSKFTFVDLAGSERLKKTMAEGTRMKEGIQINVGLLALGNVINALGDEQNQKKETFVPYRSSKLTRLLQDALGGNSRTLFIACISPAVGNAAESLSTLQYANRARNIQNKAVKNLDPRSAEVSNLHAYVSILQRELVRSMYCDNDVNETKLNTLLADPKVQQYLKSLKDKDALLEVPASSAIACHNDDMADDDDDNATIDVTRIPSYLSVLELALEKEAAVSDRTQGEHDFYVQRQALELKRRREIARRDTLEHHLRALNVNVDEYDTCQKKLAALHQRKLAQPHDESIHSEWKAAHERLQPIKKAYAAWTYTTDRLRDAKQAIESVDDDIRSLEARLKQLQVVTEHIIETKDKEIERVRKYPQSTAKWSHLNSVQHMNDLEALYGKDMVKRILRQLEDCEKRMIEWLDKFSADPSKQWHPHAQAYLTEVMNRLHIEDTEASLMQALRKRATTLTSFLRKGPLGDQDKMELQAIDESIQTLSDTLKRLEAEHAVLSQPETEKLSGEEAAAVIQDLVAVLEHSKRMELCAILAKQSSASSHGGGGSTLSSSVATAPALVLAREDFESQLHAWKLQHEREMIETLKNRDDNSDVYIALEAKEHEVADLKRQIDIMTKQIEEGKQRESAFAALQRCQEMMAELGIKDDDSDEPLRDITTKCQVEFERLLLKKQESYGILDRLTQAIQLCEKALGCHTHIDLPKTAKLTDQIQLAQTTLAELENTVAQRALLRLRNLKTASELCDDMQLGIAAPVPESSDHEERMSTELQHQLMLQGKIAEELHRLHNDMSVFSMFDSIGQNNVRDIVNLTTRLLAEGNLPLGEQALEDDTVLITLLNEMKESRLRNMEEIMQNTRHLFLELQFVPDDLKRISRKVVDRLSFAFEPLNLVERVLNTGGVMDFTSHGLSFMQALFTTLLSIREIRIQTRRRLKAKCAIADRMYQSAMAQCRSFYSPPKVVHPNNQERVTNGALTEWCEHASLGTYQVRKAAQASLSMIQEELDAFGMEEATDRLDFILGTRDRAISGAHRKLLEKYMQDHNAKTFNVLGASSPSTKKPNAPHFLHELDPYATELGSMLAHALDSQVLDHLQSELNEFRVLQTILTDAYTRLSSLGNIMKCVTQIRDYNKKIAEFESAASDSDRLLDRRTSSLRLLDEEKFRKSAAKKYPLLVQKVREEIHKWTSQTANGFDLTILGQDMQALLLDTVNLNTDLMHLSLTNNSRRSRKPV